MADQFGEDLGPGDAVLYQPYPEDEPELILHATVLKELALNRYLIQFDPIGDASIEELRTLDDSPKFQATLDQIESYIRDLPTSTIDTQQPFIVAGAMLMNRSTNLFDYESDTEET